MTIWRLYTRALQDPPSEVEFVRRMVDGNRLREDFCGSAAIARQWVSVDRNHEAIALDIDRDALKAATASSIYSDPGDDAERLSLRHADSLVDATPRIDITFAGNASIFLLHTRSALKTYLLRAYEDLNPGGAIVIDGFGGSATMELGVSQEVSNGMLVRWANRIYDPVTNRLRCVIQLCPPEEGLPRAEFEYDLRIWSPSELVDALCETGFTETRVAFGTSRREVFRGQVLAARETASLDEWEYVAVAHKL